MSSYIEVRNVSKSFSGRAILQNISLSVEQGTTVGLVGANGSGKSVLFKIICGFEKPDQGQLVLCEEKDRLTELYGLIRCSAEQLKELNPQAVIGKSESPYGVEAVVRRAELPAGWEVSPIDIEELFVK